MKRPYYFVVATVLFAALAVGAVPVAAAGQRGGSGSSHGGGGFHGAGGVHSGGFHGGSGVHSGGSHDGAPGSGRPPNNHDRGDHGRPEFRGDFHGDHARRGFHGDFHDRFGGGFLFRPRLGVGFGVFLGYPFDYPLYDPWDYPGYPIGMPAYIPGQGYGGVSFAISPADASVAVDGTYAGTVNQFASPQSPLNLAPGPHHIEIQAAGYSTLDFDVNVEAGQVIPYAGDLQPN